MFISITAVGEWKRHVATKNKQGGKEQQRISTVIVSVSFQDMLTVVHSTNTISYMKLHLHTNGAPDSLSVT